MKKIVKRIIITCISLIVFGFILIVYIVNKNDNYMKNILNDIKENYDIEDKIDYYSMSNGNYVILTSNNLIILDEEFEEVFKEDLNNIVTKDKKYDIVYKNDIPMYEMKEQNNRKIKYIYYDLYTGELIEEIEIEG